MNRIIYIVCAVCILLSACITAPQKKEAAQDVVFYPPLPATPKLQHLVTINDEDDIGKEHRTSFDDYLEGKSSRAMKIGRPWDIASSRGKIYLLDRDYQKVLIVDLVKKNIDFLKDKRVGKLYNPSGIWVTDDDLKYVIDSTRKQVLVYGKDNKFIRSYGGKKLFDKPLDVAVYGNFVYVIDMDKYQLFVLDKETGKLVKTIGEGGAKEGMFHKPTHVTVDHAGNIFVNDAFNFRVQKFSPEGDFLLSFGSLGDTMGSFARPKGLDIDKNGNLYVVDAAFGNVQIFDSKTAELLLYFGGARSGSGSMWLPAGVHIDYDNIEYFSRYVDKDFQIEYLVYIGNLLGSRKLNVYGFGKWIGPPLSEGEESENEPSESEDTMSDQASEKTTSE
jgi:hypothetical protein